MASTEDNKRDFIRNININGPYTIEEARDVMRTIDGFGVTSALQPPIKWVNVKTRRLISFSY